MKNKSILVLTLLCLVSSAVMIFSLIFNNSVTPQFVPPEFEESTARGTPNVPIELGWSELYREGMNYSVGICGNIIAEGSSADIYFTNPAKNNVWLKLRVVDLEENNICETGLIKPNEYIKSVHFNREVTNSEKVKIKIMAYEPETYYSEGAVVLNTVIKCGG